MVISNDLLNLYVASCDTETKKTHSSSTEMVTIDNITDNVAVPVNPDRVVALGYGALENMDLIDANVVGTSKAGLPHYLSKYENDPLVMDLGNLVEANMRAINELQPDLIFLGAGLMDFYKELSEIAPTVIPTFDAEDQMGALKKNLNDLARIFNRQDTCNKAYEKIQEKIVDTKNKTRLSNEKALVVLPHKERLSVYGSGSCFGLIHKVLGINEAVIGLDTHLHFHNTSVSKEFIQHANPDILFVIDRNAAMDDMVLNNNNVENEFICQTDAYKNDKVVYLDPEAWGLPGSGTISMNIMIDEVAQVFKSSPMVPI